ncbi:hypothetical protein PSCICJ_31080 [Pseudomonas cichorii]|nr:hypothetical protein PSCICJ_31080 [Pseudomonas cichorii]
MIFLKTCFSISISSSYAINHDDISDDISDDILEGCTFFFAPLQKNYVRPFSPKLDKARK